MDTKTLCLGALLLKDGSGYDIKKLFETTFSHFQNASLSSIYPSLVKLEKEGSVTYKIKSSNKNPDKKLFKLTKRGEKRFIDSLINTNPTEILKSDFLVLLFFSHLIERNILKKKLIEIEDHFNSKLNFLNTVLLQEDLTPGMSFGVEQGIAVYSAKLKHLKKNKNLFLEKNEKVKKNANAKI
tara:strand:- start:43488 stop:44036 length:549 start_codon:yes stop_codon:yes gene_type:complete